MLLAYKTKVDKMDRARGTSGRYEKYEYIQIIGMKTGTKRSPLVRQRFRRGDNIKMNLKRNRMTGYLAQDRD
jgi:hypothetical protein